VCFCACIRAWRWCVRLFRFFFPFALCVARRVHCGIFGSFLRRKGRNLPIGVDFTHDEVSVPVLEHARERRVRRA